MPMLYFRVFLFLQENQTTYHSLAVHKAPVHGRTPAPPALHIIYAYYRVLYGLGGHRS